jgi:hypothetical protein
MKDHGRLIASLCAITLVLTAMVVLVHQGQKLDAMASLGFGVVLGNLTGAFSPSFTDRRPEPPGAHSTTTTATLKTEIQDPTA